MSNLFLALGQSQASAMQNRIDLAEHRVLGVQLSGSPGSGKTALIQASSECLKNRARCAAIIAHPAAERDARRLLLPTTIPIEAHHLDAEQIHHAIASLDLPQLDILFIETPSEEPIDIGENARVALFSVTGGDDKAAEFPQRVQTADLVLLNKIDLLSFVKFDAAIFRNDVARLNPPAELIEISARDGSGMQHWITWLLRKRRLLLADAVPTPSRPEWWFGDPAGSARFIPKCGWASSSRLRTYGQFAAASAR